MTHSLLKENYELLMHRSTLSLQAEVAIVITDSIVLEPWSHWNHYDGQRGYCKGKIEFYYL